MVLETLEHPDLLVTLDRWVNKDPEVLMVSQVLLGPREELVQRDQQDLRVREDLMEPMDLLDQQEQ